MEQKLKEIIQFAEDNYPPKKFQHAMRVMCYTQEMCVEHGYCDDVELSALIVAVLHDIVEDTPIQEETLPNWCLVNENVLSQQEQIIFNKSLDLVCLNSTSECGN